VTLNRVIGNNGQVFIVNSAGVLFTKDSQVNVGGLVASTLDISNANFMAGLGAQGWRLGQELKPG
jgi:large exoprotein involved in heme utilization and adhesion